MRILIASGIYPPDIGGPAQYARNLYEVWKGEVDKDGLPQNDVKVAAYRWERAFPPVVRHFLYFLKIIRKGWKADLILVLDTWSAAVPAMAACKLMGKKYILRTGGDFLWESYIERSGEMVLFKDFYATNVGSFSFKDKLIYKLSGAALRGAAAVVFSTKWQKDVFEKAYKLDPKKGFIIENKFGPKEEPIKPEGRVFVAGSRFIKLKNLDMVKRAFERAREEIKNKGFEDIELDTSKAMYSNFVEKIRNAYAIIVGSLSDISPNMVADALRVGTPYIVTRENGIKERLSNTAIFIDPLNENDIVEKIVWMADPKNREAQVQKIKEFNFVHTWKDIATEIIEVWKIIKQ